MKLRTLLLKLKLTSGFGIKSEYAFYKFLRNKYTVLPIEINFSALDIAKCVNLSNRYYDKFCKSFNSKEVNDSLKYHLEHVKFISILDKNYPIGLKESYLPPIIIFYFGNISLIENKMLGVVGSRKNTDYAFKSLNMLIPKVVQSDIVVVSGLAAGVDKLSHQCTIANGGKAVAVIGTGLDIYYPRENEQLQRNIAINHLLISEYPVGSKPLRFHFPERNRIIAGLIDTLLVIEAKNKSGSLITANLALQNNRNVLAIPGRIDSLHSVGCNELILAGAKPVLSAKDIIEEFYYK
ncbi:DNA-protecting protein DprA [Apilactobacillus timberlakei]|uniref:DNA-processing protein DprA n=1 Tax=Apilactobacillus timberlakei TaxID=2008380 RepID=UPI00112E3066|nr:DNA-processing protein DprA [Apilactobacillus timberlakei]TPR20104.1 DNA-protecting protein DprA [Apilactobacillus timberlakei]TPR21822.1 DNA-protecting protein DprA [Apilactobacillus timberlakei]TPR23068.1 DNA-protecting protein DprA [Apilactobacillus timberlakei]TPR24006.1 DNA-protecting protein DprA [Apilactobacillus timberlakei]